MRRLVAAVLGSALLLVASSAVRAEDGPSHAPQPPAAGGATTGPAQLLALGREHRAAGRLEPAAVAFRQAIDALDRPPVDAAALAGALTELGTLRREQGAPADAQPMLARALELRRSLHPGDDADVAESLRELANTLDDLKRSPESVGLLETAVAMLQRLHAGDHRDTARCMANLASSLVVVGRAPEAVTLFEQSLAMHRRVYSGDHLETERVLDGLAGAREEIGDANAALSHREEALAMCRRLFPGNHDDTVRCLRKLAQTLVSLGRAQDAVPLVKEAVAMVRALHEGDSVGLADALGQLALVCALTSDRDGLKASSAEAERLDRRLFEHQPAALADGLGVLAQARLQAGLPRDAIPLYEEALAITRRIPTSDPDARSVLLNGVAVAHYHLGEFAKAMPFLEETLAIERSAHPEGGSTVAVALSNLASAQSKLGNYAEAAVRMEESLEIQRRLTAGDSPGLAGALNNLAWTYFLLSRYEKARPLAEQGLAMRRRLYGRDHPSVANSLAIVASIRLRQGHPEEALAFIEESVAMRRRLAKGPSPELATGLNDLGLVLSALGRFPEAIGSLEESLDIQRALFPGDHADLARSLSNLAFMEEDAGRPDEALRLARESLAMQRRIFGPEHADILQTLTVISVALTKLGAESERLPIDTEAVSVARKLYPGDHSDKATALNNLAALYYELGRVKDGLTVASEALAMRRRLHPGDHPDTVVNLVALGWLQRDANDRQSAVATFREAAEMAERLGTIQSQFADRGLAQVLLDAGDAPGAAVALARAIGRLEAITGLSRGFAAEDRARLRTTLRRGGDPFALMVEAQMRQGRVEEALGFAERGRAREMLALLGRGHVDPLAHAVEGARSRGDAAALSKLEAAARDVAAAESRVVERHAAATSASGQPAAEVRALADAEAAARRDLLAAQARQARLAIDEMPDVRTKDAAGLQALLDPDERMVVYAFGDDERFAFLVRPAGKPIEAIRLSTAGGSLSLDIRRYVDLLSLAANERDEAGAGERLGKRLFEALLTPALWSEIRAAKRVYVVAQGPAQRLPFEALVTGELEGKPRYWLDEGPPIAYVASGSVLAWLRARREPTPSSLSIVAVGDPLFEPPTAIAWPESGVLVEATVERGIGAAAGIRPGDVLVRLGETRLETKDGVIKAVSAMAPGRPQTLEVIRDGETRRLQLRAGDLGLTLANSPPSVAGPALAAGPSSAAARARGRSLSKLPGTRREVDLIGRQFVRAVPSARLVALLGKDATEARLFAEAPGARFLHLATHGLVDETQSASFSSLALTMPRVPIPGDDGFLTLNDLLQRWQGKLVATDLVVLSGCRTQRGRIETDEAPLALSIGFWYAGCRSVVASLWKVDDDDTAPLMEAFYANLLAPGDHDRCEALRDAKRTMRRSHPDPYSWAAFTFAGDPK